MNRHLVCRLIFELVVNFLSARLCLPYNLEARLPLFKYGPAQSKFGFSVAMHRTTVDDLVDERGTMLMAGAPTAEYFKLSDDEEPLRRPERPGGVFYCPVTTDPSTCTQIRIDKGGDHVVDRATNVTTIRSNQWLGATVESQGSGKYLVACAHKRSQRTFVNQKEAENERLCGKCFLLKAAGMSKIEEIFHGSVERPSRFFSSPCDLWAKAPRALDMRSYGYSQSGAAAVFEGDDRIVLGAPGAWKWSGTVFDFELPDAKETSMKPLYQTTRAHRSKFSYTGFSLAISRNVTSSSDVTQRNELFYAAGAPRQDNRGAVVFFNKGQIVNADGTNSVKLIPHSAKTVLGERVASSFGYSVVLTDLNSDGLDDLIVGAPQYYEEENGKKLGGAVYIYINKKKSHFGLITPTKMCGSKDSFFGHAIAALGDIDQDGYNDFAVGAPYEGKNGAVHIFRGGKGDPREYQVLKGSDYPFVKREFQEIVGFGISLSGSIDADSNKYPDLLIGTLSDSMALFRSRPVVTVDATMAVSPTEVDLDSKPCSRGKSAACFVISFCLSYSARHVRYPDGVAIKYNLTLDSIRLHNRRLPRIDFQNGDAATSGTLNLPNPTPAPCFRVSYNVSFTNKVQDKLTPVEVLFEYDLDIPDVAREKKSEPLIDLTQDPILDADSQNKITSTLTIKNTCGKDGCQSDLVVGAEMQKEVNAGEDAILTIHVANRGEEAHRAIVNIFLPPGVDYEVANISGPRAKGMSCFPTSEKSKVVRCGLGNPYKGGMEHKIEIRLSTLRLDKNTASIEVRVEGSTKSNNAPIPPVALYSKVVIQWSASLEAAAQPEQVRYQDKEILGESAMQSANDIGPLIEYAFNVKNSGEATISGAVLKVDLPIEIANGKWLLYLVMTDVDGGRDILSGACDNAFVNNLQLDPSAAGAVAAASFGRRNKRSAKSAPNEIVLPDPQASTNVRGDSISVINLSCKRKNVRCATIECGLDDIEPSRFTTILMQIQVWEATFLEEFKNVDFVHVTTEARLEARDPAVQFLEGFTTTVEVQTTIDHGIFASDVTAEFPWWYLLISGLLLLLVYIAIIACLARRGFFTRKKFPRVEVEDENVAVLEDSEKREDAL